MPELLLIIAFIIFIFFFFYFQKKKVAKKRTEELRNSWGQLKQDERYYYSLVEKYFRKKELQPKQTNQIISDKVSADLDLENVFRFVDRTISRIGQQYLYYKLRTLHNDNGELKQADQLAEMFSGNEAVRSKTQLLLARLQKRDGYYFTELLFEFDIKAPGWFPFVYVLSIASFGLLILTPFFPVLVLFFFPLFIINIIIHYWNKRNIGYYAAALQEYLKTYKVAARLSEIPEIKSHFQDSGFLKKLRPFNRRMWFIGLNNIFEADASAIFYGMFELLKITFNLEVLTFFSLIKKAGQETRALHQLFEFIGETDCSLSVASLRYGLGEWCKPDFGEAGSLDIQQVVHPLIVDCEPNNLKLNGKSLLLTGSNMSGKTTFIRTVAINMLLGQTIYTCLARSFKAPCSRVFSSIRISDDLLQDKSYYLEEVTTIKEFIDRSLEPEPCLFVLDEIFKGTNTIERVSAGKAILSFLATGTHIVLVSTHDIELTELLEENFDLYHFSESIQDSQLVFDHKIKEGPLKTRNAIRILELNNYPAEIVEDAGKTVNLIEQATHTL